MKLHAHGDAVGDGDSNNNRNGNGNSDCYAHTHVNRARPGASGMRKANGGSRGGGRESQRGSPV